MAKKRKNNQEPKTIEELLASIDEESQLTATPVSLLYSIVKKSSDYNKSESFVSNLQYSEQDSVELEDLTEYTDSVLKGREVTKYIYVKKPPKSYEAMRGYLLAKKSSHGLTPEEEEELRRLQKQEESVLV